MHCCEEIGVLWFVHLGGQNEGSSLPVDFFLDMDIIVSRKVETSLLSPHTLFGLKKKASHTNTVLLGDGSFEYHAGITSSPSKNADVSTQPSLGAAKGTLSDMKSG